MAQTLGFGLLKSSTSHFLEISFRWLAKTRLAHDTTPVGHLRRLWGKAVHLALRGFRCSFVLTLC